MRSQIEFNHLYKETFIMETKKEIRNFFKEMKERVCEDLQNKHVTMSTLFSERPIWEKIEIRIVASQKEETDAGYTYQGVFEVVGIYTRNCYDRIVVELENVDFLSKVPSIDEYLSVMFKLRYSGLLMTKEDVLNYSRIAKKSYENERLMSLCKVDEVPAKEFETHASKVQRLAKQLAQFVGRRPFEIYYGLGTITQRVFYVYDEKEHFSFLCYLVDRTRTHDVTIRFIDNEIAEWFKLVKGLYETKVRRVQS